MATYSQFPSPCGDYGSYQAGYLPTDETSRFVSVPLRGLWFLSPNYDARLEVSPNGVSVPLRGLWFLSEFTSTAYIESQLCFRPLAGIMVLIEHLRDRQRPVLHGCVSVPLRGLWFLSAPFINAFMKPSKWHFAGRIIYFHHFLSFAGK